MEYIYIKVIGRIDTKIVKKLVASLKMFYPFKFKILKSSPEYPIDAFEPRRNQYYADRILLRLIDEFPDNALKLIGITDVDLCTPILTYIFGEAILGGRVAILSSHRLRQEFYKLPRDDELLLNRLIKEFIHEMGHCFGMVHCDNPSCAMFLSNSILSIDSKLPYLCFRCSEFFIEQLKGRTYEKIQDPGC